MSRIEFIYFDLGNVLISFDHSRAFHHIARLTGISPERVEQILFNSGLQAQYEKGEISTREFHSYFCKQSQRNVSLEDLCFAASNIFEPLDDSIQLLQLLKQSGSRLGLLSNTCDCHWQFCRDDARFKFLYSSFEQMVLSFAEGQVKPETEIYRIAAKRAGCDPKSILFIDDMHENVRAAESFGFVGVQFQDVTELRNELIKRELLQ